MIDRRQLRRWLGTARPADGAPPTAVAAAATLAVARHHGVAPPAGLPGDLPPLASPPPADWATPRLAGLVYEALAEPTARRSRGAWFTPAGVVDGLVGLALAGAPAPRSVLDPACGGGAFLLGVADALHARGVPAADVVGRLRGVDLDPGAAQVCRWSLDLWAGLRVGDGAGAPAASVAVGDGLAADLAPADLVVGNPPFGTPLRSGRATTPTAAYRAARPHLGPYADDAACFLDRCRHLVADQGRLVLVLPQSLLASRDAAGLLAALDGAEGWQLRHLWVATRLVFDASVHVFAPVLARAGGPPPPVGLHRGERVSPLGEAPPGSTWAEAAAAALGVPDPPSRWSGRTLGELATATSGFRDEHYGLAAACREGAEGPGGLPVVTVGQIDPLRWARHGGVRFAGRRWVDPVVDADRLAPRLVAWVARQRRPKVLLATQSPVLEPLLDRGGDLVPSTPVIAVHAEPEDLGRVASVLLAPPVVALAARRSIGTALQPEGIKLAARQVLDLPLPLDEERWDEAAALLAGCDAHLPAPEGLLWEVATLMCGAYQVEPEPLRSWWWERLPRRGSPAGRRGARG